MGTGWRREGSYPADLLVPDVEVGSWWLDMYRPAPEAGPAGQGPAITPAWWAASYWERVPLPRPSPTIPPGWGLVGKLLYLVTNGQTTFTHATSDTPFGTLEIVATGRYHVDWGDGTTTGPHSREGRPWPNGEITHVYAERGSVDVVVNERWTATWRLGSQAGVLREPRTSATIADYPLREVQAAVVLEAGR